MWVAKVVVLSSIQERRLVLVALPANVEAVRTRRLHKALYAPFGMRFDRSALGSALQLSLLLEALEAKVHMPTYSLAPIDTGLQKEPRTGCPGSPCGREVRTRTSGA